MLVPIVGCTAIVLLFLWVSPDCRHWFVIPTLFCGWILGRDVLDWGLGRIDVFDPVGVVGVLGMHFYFFTPLLQTSQGYWVEQWTLVTTPPADWRPWLGYLALLVAPGLLLYRLIVDRVSRGSEATKSPSETEPRTLRVDNRRLLVVLATVMVVSSITQILVYRHFGGLSGYVSAFVDQRLGSESGMGRLFVLSESFPLLFGMFFVVWASRHPRRRSLLVLGIFFILLLAACLLFGGLRGSRSASVWPVFLTFGLVHFYVRRITRPVVLAGIVLLGLFMYGYGFFKWGGVEGVSALTSDSARAQWLNRSRKTMLRTVVFDFGRSNVQAYLLYRLSTKEHYEYAKGRTYLGALALIVPRRLWPDRPPTKIKEGTELLFGDDPVREGTRSTWVYGLTGETLLNFGPLAVPVLFVPLGLIVGYTRRRAARLARDDLGWLVQTLLVALCFYVLAFDSSNIIVFLFKQGLVTVVPIAIASLFEVESPVVAASWVGNRSTLSTS